MLILLTVLFIGFVLLIRGADYLIDGSIAISLRYKIPKIIIGLTVVAFGTSLPELVVNTFSSFKNEGSMIYGNIIGSNIANILLILSIAGIIAPLSMKKETINREIPFSLMGTILIFFMSKNGILNRGNAIILLLFFIGFIYYIFFIAKNQNYDFEEEEDDKNITIVIFMVLIGIVCLGIGGKMVIESAIAIADSLGISKKIISLTVISIGTSLPELVASVVAAKKNQCDMAIGNVVGSNIFNIFLIMGISGLINPIEYDFKFNYDLLILIYASIILILSGLFFKNFQIRRSNSIIMAASYIGYIIYLIKF